MMKILEIINNDPRTAEMLADCNRIADEEGHSDKVREMVRMDILHYIIATNEEALQESYRRFLINAEREGNITAAQRDQLLREIN